MVTFTINIPQMLAYIPYMDPMGIRKIKEETTGCFSENEGNPPLLKMPLAARGNSPISSLTVRSLRPISSCPVQAARDFPVDVLFARNETGS